MTGRTRLTVAQALVRFLANPHVECDGGERRFFAGCFGIFGHSNACSIYTEDETSVCWWRGNVQAGMLELT